MRRAAARARHHHGRADASLPEQRLDRSHHVQPPRRPARTLEAIRGFDPDVIHLHEPLTPGPTHAALVGTDLPAVGTFHAAYGSGSNRWYLALRRPLQRMVDRLTICTSVSAEASRDVEASFGVECRVLFNGVEVDQYVDAEPWPSPDPAILFIGRHEPRKGLTLLLDAFAGLERPARLWIASTGPQTEQLRAAGSPTWSGSDASPSPTRPAGSGAATIVCFPSTDGESFGVVLLEAMAAGTAVVASDLVGYRAVAETGHEARLVPAGDHRALRDALRGLLDDPEGRAEDRGGRRGPCHRVLSMDHLAGAVRGRVRRSDPHGAGGTVRARPVRLTR